jgi:malate dehydrogenase
VLVTGAAGQIAYSLIFLLSRGALLGPSRLIQLHLLDVPAAQARLDALVMELEDTASPLLAGVVATTDTARAFAEVDVAILVGSRPRAPGMTRADLLSANAAIFKEAGAALEAHAKRSVKVLVVGNPANTNALICARAAPSLPRTAFSCLSRLDHNRATALLARRIGANPGDVRNVIVWGNHSATQVADARFAMREGWPRVSDSASVGALVGDAAWLHGEFVETVQQRGTAVMEKRGLSSAASAASAIVDHMRDWMFGTSGYWTSMGVWTDGKAYGLSEGLFFSMPCVCSDGEYHVVDYLSLDEWTREKIRTSEQELIEERGHLTD